MQQWCLDLVIDRILSAATLLAYCDGFPAVLKSKGTYKASAKIFL